MPLEDDAHLASDRPKARILAQILNLVKDSTGSQSEMDLLQAIFDRHPVPDPSTGKEKEKK